jgi:hypothetical protein
MNEVLKIDPLKNTIIYDEGFSNIRKKMENIKKLRQSAQKGNLVSKKLL